MGSHFRNGGGIMANDVTDMSTPVTRGELRDELSHLERKLDNKLDLWGGALLARIAESEKRVLNELARHTQAVFESMPKQISVVDEKYKDLPERTARLGG